MAYNNEYNWPKIYHMISVSNREIEGKIFNMINSFRPLVPQISPLSADLYVDWATNTLRDINGDFVDDLQVRDGLVNEAPLTKYKYLDNNSILVTDRNLHSQTVSGLPAVLQGYDGDLTVVYHGLSMSSSLICMMITSIDSATNTNSGFKMTIYNTSVEVIVTRESGNAIIARYILPQQPPHAGKIHTYSFSYIADDGSGNSSLRAFWDGISVAYVEKPHAPLSWETSNGIYMDRSYFYPVVSTTYNAGLKVFKRALTQTEMSHQHGDIPRVFNNLPITNSDEAYIVFTIENLNMDGFIVRMSSMFPFNTENRSYKIGFLDTVKNLVTNAIITSQIKTLSLIADVDTFNPYTTLPYDIIVTRDLYPDLFPLDTHEHKINVRLLNSDNGLVYQSTQSVTSLPIPTFELLPDIFTDWPTKTLRGKFGDVLDYIDVYRNKVDLAFSSMYDIVDGDVVLVTNRNIHSQTVSGVLPSPLLNYDGDLSISCHFLSLINDGTESLILTSIDPNVTQSSSFHSGWTISIIGNQLSVRIGRRYDDDIELYVGGTLALNPPYASQLHSVGFVYNENNSGLAYLKAYFDGVIVGSGSRGREPMMWDTSTGIFFNRLNDTVVNGTTYTTGFKLYKKALLNAEMLELHINRPVLVDKLIVATQDDFVVNVSFENVTYDGFIVRINEVFPYNTDDVLYKLGFRDEVFDIATNTRVAIGVVNLQTNAETANFDSYNLPYDIPISKALYPGLFHTDIHEHRIELRLQTNTNALLLEIKGLFISPHILNPPIVPNLLFDVNFTDSSLDVDYTMDGNPLTFEAPIGNITPEDGFVTITPPDSYIKLTQGLPTYLKHSGNQSWVVNFRTDTTTGTRFIVHTRPTEGSSADTYDIRTGFVMFAYDNNLQVFINKGIASTLVNLSATFPDTNLSINVNSAVFTYKRLNHELSLYFNGVFLSSIVANPAFADDEIDWTTSDNLYVNKSHGFIPDNKTYYHKITAYDTILTLTEIEEIYIATKSLLEVNFLRTQSLQSLGLAESVVTTLYSNFTFNANNQFVTTASNEYLYIKPSNWSALVPAIQASLQLKMKLFIPSGTDFYKFFLRDVALKSGPYIQLTGVIPNIELEFTLRQNNGDNGNSGHPYYAKTIMNDVMSVVPDLFDVEHEWRFEHKILTGDPDGYVKQEIYLDDVLIHSAKYNSLLTGEAQKLIGYNQETGADSEFHLQLGQVGTRVSYFIMNEKPPPQPLSLLEVNFLRNAPNAQNRFQSLGLAESVVTTSSQSPTFNVENQFVTTSSYEYLYINPSIWSALVPAIQASLQLKMKLFLPSGPENQQLLLRDVVVGSGFLIRMSGTIPNIELHFYLLQMDTSNGGQPYYAFTLIPDLMSVVPDLFDVEHEWRFEHQNLTGDPDGYAEQEIYLDDVLLKHEKINFSGTSSAQKAIGFNQGTAPENYFSLRLGNIGSRVSYFIMNEKPV